MMTVPWPSKSQNRPDEYSLCIKVRSSGQETGKILYNLKKKYIDWDQSRIFVAGYTHGGNGGL